VKLALRLMAWVAVVNLFAALATTSAAHAEPESHEPVDKQFVTTESRAVKCVITTGSASCTGNFAKQPTGCGAAQFCHQDDSEHPHHTVRVEAEVEGLQWSDSNLQSDGYTDTVLTYGEVFHLEGWTVEPSSLGTRFTNDQTGRGMFVSRQGVDYRPANPIGESGAPNTLSQSASPCSSATAEALKSATLRLWGYGSEPFTVDRVLCSGDWAKSLLAWRPMDANPPGIVLFHYDGGTWRAVQYGSGFDCTDDGVPPPIAADLECGG